MRASNVLKLALIAGAILATAYTVNVYMHIVNKLTANEVIEENVQDILEARGEKNSIEIKFEKKDTPEKIDREPPKLPNVEMSNQICDMKIKCDTNTEIPVQVISGAANIIGPSICVGGKWLMSNSIGNVNRGMNVAVVNGRTGEMTKTSIFDLYEVDSTDFESFVTALNENEIIIMTTYDDATQKLKPQTKDVLAELGSEHAKKMDFRDNWIFIGGKKLGKSYEQYIKSDKDVNKYGNWPAALRLEECVPML